jgi:hypothetical protein
LDEKEREKILPIIKAAFQVEIGKAMLGRKH